MKRGPTRHEPGRRRLARALVAALLLHLVLLLVPGTDAPPAPSLQVTLLVPPPAPRPEAVTTRASPEAGQRRDATTERHDTRPSRPVPHASARRRATREETAHAATRRASPEPPPAAPPDAPPEAPGVVAHEDAPPQTALPKVRPAAPGVSAPAPPPAPTIDLFPKDLFARLAGGSRPAEPLTEEARIQGRIQATLREMQARDRVAVGLVDPYFRDLADHFDGAFAPDWSVFGGKAARPGLAGALRGWLRDYQATARRYARTGSPYRPGERDSTLLRGGPRFVPDTTVSGARPLAGLGAEAGLMDLWRDMVHGRAAGLELVAVLRVTQSPDGGLLDVRLQTPSGRPSYDRLALRAVRDALRDPLPPTRAGVGLGLEGQRIESLWAFRTRFTVVPPLFALSTVPNTLGAATLAACDLDSNGGIERCFRPLQRNTFTRVELLAVY